MRQWSTMMAPRNPPLTSDQVRLLEEDNVVGPKAKGLADLGIAPTAAEAVVPAYLTRFRRHGRRSAQTA